jgi:hypothetical protein
MTLVRQPEERNKETSQFVLAKYQPVRRTAHDNQVRAITRVQDPASFRKNVDSER